MHPILPLNDGDRCIHSPKFQIRKILTSVGLTVFWLRCGFAFYVSWKAHLLAIPCIQKQRKNFCCAFCRCNKLARARITFEHVMPTKYAKDYKIMQNMQRIIETRAGKNFMPCIRYWISNSHYMWKFIHLHFHST